MRTEAQKLSMEPIRVKLGETEYDIPLLRTMKQREWRKLLMVELGTILGGFGISGNDVNRAAFQGGLLSALIHTPEKIADLLFAYAPTLPKDLILEEATEEQLVAAFSLVTEVAYPFLQVLRMTTSILNTEVSALPKPDFSN